MTSMHTSLRTQSTTRILGTLMLAAVLLIGCDSGGTETATFTLDPVTFQFPLFDQDDVQNGAVQLTSGSTQDLGPAIRDFGFTKDEVVSAEVTGVMLVRRSLGGVPSATNPPVYVTPPDAKVFDFINQAEVRLRASNVSPVTIGSRSGDFELSGETALNAQGGDVANIARADAIEAIIDLQLDSFDGGPFRVEVEVTFEVTGQL